MKNAAQNKLKDLNLTPPDNSNLHIFINFPPAGKPYWPTVLYIVAATAMLRFEQEFLLSFSSHLIQSLPLYHIYNILMLKVI